MNDALEQFNLFRPVKRTTFVVPNQNQDGNNKPKNQIIMNTKDSFFQFQGDDGDVEWILVGVCRKSVPSNGVKQKVGDAVRKAFSSERMCGYATHAFAEYAEPWHETGSIVEDVEFEEVV